MLPGGKVLGGQEIDILKQRFPQINLKIGDPLLDSFAEFDDDSNDRQVAHEATQAIAQSMNSVQQKLSAHANISATDVASVKQSAFAVMEYLKEHPVSSALVSRCLSSSDYISEHSGNVFYLSMVLGGALRDYVHRERTRQTSASGLSNSVSMNLLPLGLGAMFIDLGMIPLQHLYTQKTPLTAEDRNRLREHPNAGAAMLPEDLPPGVKMIVKTHHENMDGSGYPQGLIGSQLHIFTRIVRVVDAFDAATARHVYAEAQSPSRVIWEMTVGPRKNLYDPVVTRGLMLLIQPFPIGAKIRLTDGRYGVVCKHNRKNPFEPSVVIAFDEEGKRLEEGKLVGPITITGDGPLRLHSFENELLDYIYDVPVNGKVEFESLFSASFP